MSGAAEEGARPTKNKLVANHHGIDSFYGFDGLALQAVQFFRCGLQVGVGGFGIHVAQGFAAGFVLVHLIGDFQFGACWHVHSPLWSVTVCGLVSPSSSPPHIYLYIIYFYVSIYIHLHQGFYLRNH